MSIQKGKKNHGCSISYCKICETKRPSIHHCFLLVKKKGKPFYTNNFDEKCEVYVFDFETEANPENLGIFKCYFVAIYKFCNVCMNDMNKRLEYRCCELDTWTCFEGKSTEASFGEYFLRVAKKNVKSRWFAHNGSKFDTLFLLHYLVCEQKLIPKVIVNGFTILRLIYKNAEVLDSLLFCPTSLKNLVNMFDFGPQVKKGYYPYNYSDLNYKGPIPDKMYFTKHMDEKELKNFELWYDSKKN